MKKIFFISLIFLLSATNVFAFKKGNGFIEGSFNFTYARVDGSGLDTTSDSSFSIGIGGGAFLTNDFALSGLFCLSNTGNNGATITAIDLKLTKLFSINDKIFYSPNVEFGWVRYPNEISGIGLSISLISFDYKFNNNFVLSYVGGAYSFVYVFRDSNYLMINNFSLNNHSIYVRYIF